MKHPIHSQGSKNTLLGLCLGLLVSTSGAAFADTVAIPLGQQGAAWNIETPRHGLRKDQVEARYGAPQEKSGPVGTPPIYTWDYNQFSVYFEGDYVIHSVVKHRGSQQD